VITVVVRWYLCYGLSYRDVEELLAERGVEVDHVTVYRWVQRFTPLFADAARPCRHATGGRWFVDETYVKVAGRWRYLYRAVDQYGQVIDVLLSEHRDTAAARRLFTRALRLGPAPVEVTTDEAGPYLRVLDELHPAAAHTTERYSNNRIEADHGRLKARLRPMRGLERFRSAERIAAGHAFAQNLRRGHYELATEVPAAPPGDSIPRARTRDVTCGTSRLDACHLRQNATDGRGVGVGTVGGHGPFRRTSDLLQVRRSPPNTSPRDRMTSAPWSPPYGSLETSDHSRWLLADPS